MKNDIIHFDNTIDHELALKLPNTHEPSFEKLKDPGQLKINQEDCVLIPRKVGGFVLNSRKWVNQDVNKLQFPKQDSQLWEHLQLHSGYKEALLSLSRNHVQPDSFEQPHFDLINSKGNCAAILLLGPPGFGRTFTAGLGLCVIS